MMTTNTRKPRWFFYPAWVALNTISVPIALGITWVFISLITKVVGDTIQVGGHTGPTEDYLVGPILILVLGLLTGFLQFLLLRRYLPRMGWWIAATTSGLLLGGLGIRLLIHTLLGDLDSMWFAVLIVVLVGGSLGLVQWVVLRQRVRHAAWWILANVLGWGVLGLGWVGSSLSDQMIIPIVGILLLVPSIATSVTLWLLLDQLPRGNGSGKNPIPSKSLEPTR